MNKQAGSVRLGKGMLAAGWIIGLIFLTLLFGQWERQQVNPNQTPVSTTNAEGQPLVQLQRNRFGHYVANGYINDHRVQFLLDTGASDVAVPAKLAKQLALPVGRPQMSFTANGTVETYATELEQVELGDIRLQQVDATIVPNMEGDQVLLGMSFLKQLDFRQQGDVLTLEVPAYQYQ